jgi:hypothetical protein
MRNNDLKRYKWCVGTVQSSKLAGEVWFVHRDGFSRQEVKNNSLHVGGQRIEIIVRLPLQIRLHLN